jgi:polyhydroxyalkanoate synthase subunit PhaC
LTSAIASLRSLRDTFARDDRGGAAACRQPRGDRMIPVLAANDEFRRTAGMFLDLIGLGPVQTPSRIAGHQRGFQLKAYQEPGYAPALLIIPAPIKRAYIWDLLPEVSVVARCRARDFQTYLLEWIPPTPSEDEFGLAEYADAFISTALDTVRAETEQDKVTLAGHSLGGTFAAIFAASHPERIQALVLVEAPLAFGERQGPLERAASLIPSTHDVRAAVGSPVPGSFLNLISVAAAPRAFVWQPWSDLLASMASRQRATVHACVMRWTLDEFPLPGRLFEETVELLYRQDQFRRGKLQIGRSTVGTMALRGPVLAVVNPHGDVVPPDSCLAVLDAVPDDSKRIHYYQEESGPSLQHVGPLVGPNAHKHLWPEILDWVRAQATRPERATAR